MIRPRLEEIVLSEDVRHRIIESILEPVAVPRPFLQLNNPDQTDFASIFLRDVLLSGLPGVGKTLLAHAISASIGATMYSVKISHINNKCVGRPEKSVIVPELSNLLTDG